MKKKDTYKRLSETFPKISRINTLIDMIQLNLVIVGLTISLRITSIHCSLKKPVAGEQKEADIFQYSHGPLGLIGGNPAKTPITVDSALDPRY